MAVVYAVAGKLALLMAIPPGYATAVWPASGLALGFALVSRQKALPGVFLGSFLANVDSSLTLGTDAGVAFGAFAQAWFGCYLVERTVGYPTSLGEAKDINRFSLAGGPLSCFVSATCGVALLSLTGDIPGEEVLFNWLTWWVGDTIGVLIFTPLVLAFFGEPADSWRRRRGALLLPLGVGFVLVVLLFLRVSAWEQARLHTDFELEASPLANRLESTLARYRDTAVAVSSLFDASEVVTETEFAAFAERALTDHPGLFALTFAQMVSDAERAEFERDHYVIRDITRSGTVSVAGARPNYAVVRYSRSLSSDMRPNFGIDVLSHGTRKGALDRAEQSKRPAVSARLELLVDKAPRASVLLAVPLFARTGALEGFAIASFRIEEIISEAFIGFDHSRFHIELLDASPDAHNRQLYGAPTQKAERSLAASQFVYEHLVSFAGRSWTLKVAATNAYAEEHRSWGAWLVLAGGLFVVGMLGVTLLLGTGREIRIEAAEAKYRDLYENSPDLYASIDRSSLRVLDCNKTLLDTLGFARSEVIGHSVLALHEGASKARVEELFRSISTGDLLQDTELTLQKRDGTTLDASLAVAANRCVWRDVSARKIAERGRLALMAQLKQLNEELEARVEKRTAELSGALREKEVLLKEVHHRVKNNLQVISSLLSLQGHHLPDESSRAMFLESQARVHSIALVHESLYGARDLSHVDFQHYAEALIQNLMYAHDASSRGIVFRIDANGVRLPVDEAIPCGLIMNELVTNSLKHAFPRGRSGTIRATLQDVGAQNVLFTVSDDGIGLAEKDLQHSTSLGLELVYTFAEQLRAEVTVEREGGTKFRFEFQRDV